MGEVTISTGEEIMKYSEPTDSNRTDLNTTLVNLFFARAQTAPHQLFCQYQSSGYTWNKMSYDEARCHVVSLAEGFTRLGLERGMGLAILAKTRWEWVALELAALRVGGFVTGLEPHLPTDDIVFRLKHSGVRALAIEAAEVGRLPESALQLLDFLILLDGPSPTPTAGPIVVTFDQLEAMGKENIAQDFPWPTTEDAAALLYTSGTTGAPKAILYRHRHVMAAVRAVENALPNVGPNDSVLCWLPLAHLFQRMINFVAISRGTPMAFLGDPIHILNAAKKIRPTILLGVPRFFEKLHLGMEEGLDRLPRWLNFLLRHVLIYPRLRRVLGGKIRIMITGSAPTPLVHLSFFHKIGLPLYEAYGVSENTVPISMNVQNEVRLGSVGRPLKENQVRFTPEGEICVKGPGVCEGYWNSETDFPLDADGFYHTGDLGKQDAQGFLYVLGRRDDMFKTSTGRKISPTRLEAVYGQSPLFDRVMAVGRGKPYPALLLWLKTDPAGAPEKGGERLPTPAQRKRIRAEIDRLGEGLMPYERAGAFLVVATPPSIEDGTLTPSLKLRRSVLEERWSTRIDVLYEMVPERRNPTINEREESSGAKKRGDRPKILFIPEGVALSHPARLLQLARQLDPETYEVHMAVDTRYREILGGTGFYMHEMVSLSSATFDRRVTCGAVVYTEDVLGNYVQQELALINLIQPDIVVGDWRPSLGISAQITRVPYISILNAYWSPEAKVRAVLPEYTVSDWMPRFLGQSLFNLLRPWGFALHARPVNAVRRRHGLAPLSNDFRHALASPDWTLYPDLEYLFPIPNLPKGHRYMAPVSWSPTVPRPAWWNRLPLDRPVVYANLGSSGRAGILQKVMEALATLPVTVIAATAGRQTGLVPPPNAFVADYLPGEASAERADLVITNGGNMSAYQALGAGKPLVGLASNTDQFLNMAALDDAGVGKLLRASSATIQEIRSAVLTLLYDAKVLRACKCLGAEMSVTPQNVFSETISQILQSGKSTRNLMRKEKDDARPILAQQP